jgi:hypothetical protein
MSKEIRNSSVRWIENQHLPWDLPIRQYDLSGYVNNESDNKSNEEASNQGQAVDKNLDSDSKEFDEAVGTDLDVDGKLM